MKKPTLYEVKSKDGNLVMIAPLAIVGALFCRHRDAFGKIEYELQDIGETRLHFNGRPVLGLDSVIITKHEG